MSRTSWDISARCVVCVERSCDVWQRSTALVAKRAPSIEPFGAWQSDQGAIVLGSAAMGARPTPHAMHLGGAGPTGGDHGYGGGAGAPAGVAGGAGGLQASRECDTNEKEAPRPTALLGHGRPGPQPPVVLEGAAQRETRHHRAAQASGKKNVQSDAARVCVPIGGRLVGGNRG